MSIERSDVHFGALQPRSSNKCFTLYYFLLYLVFMLSTYISSSLTQLTIYNLFLRAILSKEFGLKSTLLLVAILKLFVSLNVMAGNAVGVEDCEIHVHDSSLPSTSSQDNVESNLNILSTIQGATKLMVQVYHELFTLSKNDFIKALHNLGSIHELKYVRDMILPPSDVDIICQRLVI